MASVTPAVMAGDGRPFIRANISGDCLGMENFPLDEMEADVAARLVVNDDFVTNMVQKAAGPGLLITDDNKFGVDTSMFPDVAGLGDKLAAIEGRVEAAEGVAEAASNQAAQAVADVAALSGDVSDLKGRAASLESGAASQAERLNAIETLAGDNEDAIEGLISRADSVDSRIQSNADAVAALAVTVGGQGVSLSNIQASIPLINQDITKNKGDIAAFNEELQGISSTLVTLAGVDSAQGERLDAAESAMTDLTARVETLENAMTAMSAAVGQLSSDLATHIQADADLYQNIVAEVLRMAQDIYTGAVPQLDMEAGQAIIGSGGLLSLSLTGSEWVAPGNGAVIIVYKVTLLGVSPVATKNGAEVFGDGLGLLGIGNGKPVEVRTQTGDVWNFSGSLGLLASFNATFYPNKVV